MFRFIAPIILIGLAVAGFFTLVRPVYDDVSALRVKVSSYDGALDNSRVLEGERDKLTKKYNDISVTDLDRLKKLLPDNVDNIRLILEIEKIASPYGMILKDVHYNAEVKEDAPNTRRDIRQTDQTLNINKDYGTWDLEFSTEGTYDKFLNFLKDLERNLRIVDISSIQFSSADNATDPKSENSSNEDSYKYTFKIKTYWLKK